VVTGQGILVANLWAAAHPETLSWPNDKMGWCPNLLDEQITKKVLLWLGPLPQLQFLIAIQSSNLYRYSLSAEGCHTSVRETS
jgi:hypothetical protein